MAKLARGAPTAAKYDKVEKTIDRLHESKIGSMVPHEALVAGVSIAASRHVSVVRRLLTQRQARSQSA